MKNEDQNKFWELAAGKIHNENDPTEALELEELLKISRNKGSFKELQHIHDRLYQTRSLTGISRTRSWKKINHYFGQKRIRLVKTLTTYAAALIAAFFIGNLFRSVWVLSPGSEYETKVSVPLGQMSEVTLYDSTHVWLNSGTSLRYTSHFGKKDRHVSLDGEAFFKVKHSKLPFRVKLRNSEIEVTGTSFNAVSYKEEKVSQVTLIEGSVRINNPKGEEIMTLSPSQQITIPENLNDIQVSHVNADFFYSWTEGKIVFEEARLADVALRLERWYNVEIRFEGEGTGDLRFTGTILKNKPIDQIIKAFQLLLPVKIDHQNNLQKKDIIIISKQNMPMKY
ncbi:MAG: FecR family protein [Mangrovibacterium sp.]